MKEITVEQCVASILNAANDVLFLAAPNYESRSLAWVKMLKLLLVDPAPRHYTLVGMLLLQADMHQNVVLDELKVANAQRVRDSLAQFSPHQLRTEDELVHYPGRFTVGWLENLLRSWSNSLTKPITVCLDISTLPRRVILAYMEALKQLVELGEVQHLFLMYAWAERYPWEKRPTHVGFLQLSQDNTELSEFAERLPYVRGVVMAGRQGYDAKLFVDSLPPSARVDAHILLDKDDTLSSMTMVYSNYPLLMGVGVSAHANLRYVFSVSRNHQMLIQCARDTVREWATVSSRDRDCAFLVAPLGLKPMSVSAFIADSIVSRSGIKSGIALLSSYQYSDVYSLGCKKVRCFELALAQLTGDCDA